MKAGKVCRKRACGISVKAKSAGRGRLADRVVVAMRLAEMITRAERRTRGPRRPIRDGEDLPVINLAKAQGLGRNRIA